MPGWKRLGAIGGALAVATACASSQPAPTPATTARPRSTAAQDFMTPPPVPQYRLAWLYPEQAAPERALQGGVRMEQRSEGLVLADSAGKQPLQGGRAVPKHAGAGFVFWGSTGLYRTSSFLGRLEPVATAPFSVDDVSFGAKFWLARSRDGDRWAFDPKSGADVALAPQGVLDIATAGDGRVVAVLELGRAAVSLDGGVTYREVQSELGAPVADLSHEPLGFVLDQLQLMTLERDGKLVLRPPSQSRDAGYYHDRLTSPAAPPMAERKRFAPLNQAIYSGVSGRPGHALVALEASVCEVDLRTGKLVRQGPQLLPGSPECRLLRPNGELLMACRDKDDLTILSKVESERPVVERSFKGDAALRVTADRLLVERGCDADAAPFSVCTRFASGEWKQLSLRPDPPVEKATQDTAVAAGSPAPPDFRPRAFVPRADGGAVALVNELSGYVDLASGHAIHLKGPVGTIMRDPANCWVDGAGTLRCLTATGSLVWDHAGNPEPQVFQFSWVAAAGARALGRDKEGRVFQTEDYGRTWSEVAGPPGKAEGNNLRRSCSDVGCAFGGWLRTGWDPLPPRPAATPLLVETAARPEPALPTLSCSIDKPAAPAFFRSSTSATDEEENPKRQVAGFGLDRLRAEQNQLPLEAAVFNRDGSSNSWHGLLSTHSRRVFNPRAPEAELFEQEPLRFRYVDYFDPSARINTASVSAAELSQTAHRLGSASPDTDFEGGGPFPVIPVLAREPGRSAGFIVTMARGNLWLNAGRVTLLTPWDDTWVPSGALLERDGSLLVLMSGEPEGPRVWRYRQGMGVEVFGLPKTPYRPTHDAPDALAISDQGELAVLRFPSSPGAPSTDDPPLAYVPGKPLQALAPWTRLLPTTDPACAEKAGYRTLLLPHSHWFKVVQGATEIPAERGMVAAVRWSKERVCLEALEVQGSYLWRNNEQVETRLLWNPAQRNAATHVGIGSGYELREPANCQLSGLLP